MKVILGVYRTLSAGLVVPVLLAISLLWYCEIGPEDLDAFLGKYQNLLISLGTLFLVSLLAVWGTHLTNSSAERREKSNRRVQAELQVSQFRQAWINEMRDDLSEFTYLVFNKKEKSSVNAKATHLLFKIQIRLNTKEPLAKSLDDIVMDILVHKGSEDERAELILKLVEASRAYSQNEWKRLKEDIQEAQILESIK